MNKIDLIINALKNCSAFQPKKYYEIDKALAAARELKALEPVAWWNPEYESDFKISLNEFQGWNVPLYALDEVTK
jgi:hypothetical protein